MSDYIDVVCKRLRKAYKDEKWFQSIGSAGDKIIIYVHSTPPYKIPTSYEGREVIVKDPTYGQLVG